MKYSTNLPQILFQYAKILGDLDDMGQRKAEEFCKEMLSMVSQQTLPVENFRDALTILSKERKFQEIVDFYSNALSQPEPSGGLVGVAFSWV